MIPNLQKILKEWSYRVGVVKPTNTKHLEDLKDILIEEGWSYEVTNEFISTLKGVQQISSPKINLKEVIKQVSELGKIIQEASVFQDKYPVGSRFMLGIDGLKRMKQYSGQSIPGGIWLKHKEVDSAIEVIHKEDGRAEFWIKSEKNGKVYHVKGSGSVIGKWFKKATKNPGDIKFNTGTLEACALLGLKINALDWLKKFNSSTEDNISKITQGFVSEVLGALGSGDFASNDLSKIKSAPLPQVIMVAAIASGMNKFRNDKGVSGWNFIHSKIDTYYKAEQSNPHIVTQGGKANTADAIVLKGSVSSFLTNMAVQTVSFDSNGLCKLDTGEEFYQVSLKKGEGNAQLGKITTDFLNKFGLISNEDVLNMVIHENIERDILDEGLRDLFLKGKEFIKTTGKKVIDGIKKASQKVQAYYSGIISTFKGATPKANKSGDDLIIKLASKYKLNEAKKKMGVLESVQSIADAYNNKNKKPLEELVKLDNQLLTKIISLTSSTGMAYVGGVKKLSIPSNVNVDTVIKFLANYKALDSIRTVASNGKGNAKNASQIYNDFIDLEKQMFFGRTSLPLFKVYGLSADGSGNPYTFLKTGKEFAAERKSEFESKHDMVNTVFIVYVKAEGGYATTSAWIFSHFKDGKSMFNNVTFRTNSSGTVSFVIEGSQSQPWKWILSQKWGSGLV